jgi:hypothetical protein
MKQCFKCRRMLSLDEYTDNKRIYTLKTDMGKNRVCKICNFDSAVKKKSLVKYDYEQSKFVVINFNNIGEVGEYFETNNLI